MVEVKSLRAGYSGGDIIKDICFSAREGEITVILGPNGCGKSTLLKVMAGLIPVRSGEVFLDGESLLSLPRQLLARKIACLSQSRQLPEITAGRLVLHGRFPYLQYPRRYRPEDHKIAGEAMERLGIGALGDRPLAQLSGGQRQKVYLAAALAQATPVMVLDEPTTYLDAACQLQVLEQAKLLAREGKHVIMVIHDLAHALKWGDKILLMADGAPVLQGTPEEVYASGELDRVFGVKVDRVQKDGRWHYFWEAP